MAKKNRNEPAKNRAENDPGRTVLRPKAKVTCGNCGHVIPSGVSVGNCPECKRREKEHYEWVQSLNK